MNPEPSSFAAVILAAGLSTRMGAFKPLLELGGTTLVARTVALFRAAGVGDIRVVAGFKARAVASEARQAGANVVVNARYRDGMLSSVQAGLAAAAGVEAVFVLPVDVALVRPATVAALMGRFVPGALVYPVFQGRRGHPPLIDAGLIPGIVSWQGPGGLDMILGTWEARAVEVPVADKAVHLDIDTAADYEKTLAMIGRRQIPSRSEALYLLETVAGVDPKILAHGKAVAAVALSLGRALNRAGCALDLDLIQSAGLLHDIVRHQPDHAAAGAELLTGLGFAKVGAVVAVHMQITPKPEGFDEAEVVHLADKLVKGDGLVSLDARFGAKLDKYGKDPAAVQRIEQRLAEARAIAAKVERLTGTTIDQILQEQGLQKNRL